MDKATGKETASWTLTQIGVVVRDVEKTVQRLQELGIGPFEAMKLPPDRQEWVHGKPMLADAKIMGGKIGGVQLELIQPIAPKAPHMEFLNSRGEGVQHVMIAVDDLEKEIKRLTDKGCTVLLDARFPGGGHIAYIDLNAGGIIVELAQKRT